MGEEAAKRTGLPAWAPLLVFAAAWLAHGSALGADWIGDDVALVRNSAVVAEGPSGLAAAFGPAAWGGEAERGVWRPLTVYSFCLEAPLWKGEGGRPPSPFGFHLTNLFLHGFVALLLLLLGWRLAPTRPVLVVGTALVFAVHPLHAQAVLSLAGRADLLALLFSLLAALLWIGARRGQTALLPLAALSFFLALLAKETAIGLPLVLLLLGTGASGRTRGKGGGWRRLAAVGVLVVPILLWALRWPWFTPDLRAGLDGLGAATAWFFVPVGWTRDLMAATRGFTALTLSPAAAAIGLLVLALGASAILRGARRAGPAGRAIAATALLWTAAVLVSPAGLPLLPRFAYVPAFLLALLGGALLHVLWALPRGRRVGRLAACAVLVLLGLLTWTEGRSWADADAFEEALIESHPEVDALLLRRAATLRVRAAEDRRRSATRALDSGERTALIRRTARWLSEAQTYVQAVLRRVDPSDVTNPRAADAHRELGFLLQDQARAPEAVEVLREALRLDPWLHDEAGRAAMSPARRARAVETLRRLARSEEAVGEAREAAIHLAHAADLAPDDVSILHAAGRALNRAGEYTRALATLERALAQCDDARQRALVEQELEAVRGVARRRADEQLQAARRSVEAGRHGEAVAALEDALAADPTLLRAYLELALYQGQWFGRYPRAYEVIDAGEAVLTKLGYAPEDAWWRRFEDLRRQLMEMEREDLEAEESAFGDEEKPGR